MNRFIEKTLSQRLPEKKHALAKLSPCTELYVGGSGEKQELDKGCFAFTVVLAHLLWPALAHLPPASRKQDITSQQFRPASFKRRPSFAKLYQNCCQFSRKLPCIDKLKYKFHLQKSVYVRVISYYISRNETFFSEFRC